MTIRDFNTGTIRELCRPVSAEEISLQHAERTAAFSFGAITVEGHAGHLKKSQTHQKQARTGGGWKKRSIGK